METMTALAWLQRRCAPPVSLDAIEPGEEGDGRALVEEIADERRGPEAEVLGREAHALVLRAMTPLDAKHKAVVALRLVGWSYADTGRALSVSRERARQLEAEAHDAMRAALAGVVGRAR